MEIMVVVYPNAKGLRRLINTTRKRLQQQKQLEAQKLSVATMGAHGS